MPSSSRSRLIPRSAAEHSLQLLTKPEVEPPLDSAGPLRRLAKDFLHDNENRFHQIAHVVQVGLNEGAVPLVWNGNDDGPGTKQAEPIPVLVRGRSFAE